MPSRLKRNRRLSRRKRLAGIVILAVVTAVADRVAVETEAVDRAVMIIVRVDKSAARAAEARPVALMDADQRLPDRRDRQALTPTRNKVKKCFNRIKQSTARHSAAI